MQKKYLLLWFICIVNLLSAQNTTKNYPILSKQMPKGIIRNYTDFQQMKVEKVSGELFLSENGEIAQKVFSKEMKLALRDSATQKVSLIRPNLWGYSDGKDVYVRYNYQYCKLHIGKYSYFYHTVAKSKPLVPIVLTVAVPYTEEQLMFFEISSGRIFPGSSLKEVLRAYPELRKAYKQDVPSAEKTILYLQKLNNL